MSPITADTLPWRREAVISLALILAGLILVPVAIWFVGKNVFVTGYSGRGNNTTRHLVCVDRSNGKKLWSKSIDGRSDGGDSRIGQHGEASHTPVSDGEHVYVMFGSSGVRAYDFEGERLATVERRIRVGHVEHRVVDHLGVAVATYIDTRYREREAHIDAICDAIVACYRARPGNYLVFFS